MRFVYEDKKEVQEARRGEARRGEERGKVKLR